MAGTLMATTALSWAACVLYVAVGWAIAERTTRPAEAERAAGMFALWWYGLAAVTGLGGLQAALVALGDPPVSLITGTTFMSVAAACMGLAGLLYYLLFLFTGRGGYFWFLIVGYAAYAGFLLHRLSAWQPNGIEVSPWEVGLAYARPAPPGASVALFVLLIGPELLAAVALLGLSMRLPRSASRLRVLVVAIGILAWLGSQVIANVLGLTAIPVWELIELLVPIVVAASVLLVHRPPGWLRERMPPELALDPRRQGA